jgi:hypothetical protein
MELRLGRENQFEIPSAGGIKLGGIPLVFPSS